MKSNRGLLGVILLVMLAGWAQVRAVCFHALSEADEPPLVSRLTLPDNLSRHELRYASLRNVLNAKSSVVLGYVSAGAKGNEQGFFLTQYSLAPVILERSTEHKFVVANFYPGGGEPDTPVQTTFDLVFDGHNGVGLLRRKAKGGL